MRVAHFLQLLVLVNALLVVDKALNELHAVSKLQLFRVYLEKLLYLLFVPLSVGRTVDALLVHFIQPDRVFWEY